MTMFNPLGMMCIYVCTHVPTAHSNVHIYIYIYICTQYKQAPTMLSCIAKQDCRVNPCLLSSNNSRPQLFTYITTRKRQEGVVVVWE